VTLLMHRAGPQAGTLLVRFFDAAQGELGTVTVPAGTEREIVVPDGAAWYQDAVAGSSPAAPA
jgi:hypothetical protein